MRETTKYIITIWSIFFCLACNSGQSIKKLGITRLEPNYEAGKEIHFHVWKIDNETGDWIPSSDSIYITLKDVNNEIIDSVFDNDGCSYLKIPIDAKGGNSHITVYEIKNGKKITSSCCDTMINIKPEPSDMIALQSAEKMPCFPGGEVALRNFIVSNTRYPVRGDICIEGKVYVRFIIDEEGKVQNSRVIRSVDPLLDKEALRVVNMLPDFIPGEQNGQKVKVRYTVPVSFKLY